MDDVSLVLGIGSPYASEEGVNTQGLVTLPTHSLMHTHCIGKSGYGKSCWLASFYLMLLSRGIGALLIDPSGDVSRLVLTLLINTKFFDTYSDAFSRFVYLDPPQAQAREKYLPFKGRPYKLGKSVRYGSADGFVKPSADC